MSLLWAIVLLACVVAGCVTESKMAVRARQSAPGTEPQMEASIEVTVK